MFKNEVAGGRKIHGGMKRVWGGSQVGPRAKAKLSELARSALQYCLVDSGKKGESKLERKDENRVPPDGYLKVRLNEGERRWRYGSGRAKSPNEYYSGSLKKPRRGKCCQHGGGRGGVRLVLLKKKLEESDGEGVTALK